MAARAIGMARVRLSKPRPDGAAEEVGEVFFARIPVRSEDDYACLLNDILDLQQAKELSADLQRQASKPHGEAAGYTWRR